MKLLFPILFISVLIYTQDSLCSQAGVVNKGRIFTSDGRITLFKNLSPTENSYRFQTSSSTSFQEIATVNITKIEKQTGTEAGKWALYCGLGGLLGSTLGVLSAQSSSEVTGTSVNGAPIIIGLTAASALVGFLIGSGKKTYETVYTNPNMNKGTGNIESHIRLDLSIAKNNAGIKINYQF